MRPFATAAGRLLARAPAVMSGMRGAAARPLVIPAISSSYVASGSTLSHIAARRGFSSSTARPAPQYRRWDRYPSGQPNDRNDVMTFVKRRVGGDRGLVIYGVLIGGGVIYYVAHLERVPVTGRLRFMDCTEAQESEIGRQTFGETMSQFRGKILPPNHPISKRVRAIAKRIVERNGLGKIKEGGTLSAIEDVMGGAWGMSMESGTNIYDTEGPSKNAEWEVYVVDDKDTQNAFVIPGGKIFVFTGILPVSDNDSGLATVMGHEVAHVVARHGAERMSFMKVLFGISFLLETLGLDVGLTRALVTFMLMLPQSRTNETEADTIGLQLMARACYDPTEAPRMWERMSKMGGGGGGFDFLSTHPANQKRIKALEKEQPEAKDIVAQACGQVSQNTAGFGQAYKNFGQGEGMSTSLWG